MSETVEDPTLRIWLINRIRDALDQADLARAAAADLDDHALTTAVVRLADDLEAAGRILREHHAVAGARA